MVLGSTRWPYAGILTAFLALVPMGLAITTPMIDAITGGGAGLLPAIGSFLGILVTVSIGFAIVRAIRG